ncbi:hypothetical protein BDQ17DRAFT_1323246 [Cyathus striatus]|nr:hypothetical protein BDQ17DRAFT_1323246 [Cyathus striatus]
MPAPPSQSNAARNDYQSGQQPPRPVGIQGAQSTPADEEGRKLLKTRMVKVFVALKTSESKEGEQSIESVEVRNKTIGEAIDLFTESAQIASDCIDSLSKIHPFIAGPLLAFKLVINLDLKRRENNLKVLAIKAQMQSLICTLYRLRDIKEVDEEGPDGLTLEGRLKDLMAEITDDIERCASDCDLYLKKSLLRKFLKAPIYESRLAKYAAKFTDHEMAVERALQMHSVFTIEANSKKLDATQAQVRDVQEDLKKILHVLDTAPERQIRHIIEEAGGGAACLRNEAVRKDLISKTGEPLPTTGVFVSPDKMSRDDFNSILSSLLADLRQDIDQDMEQNFTLFKGKLDIQADEIKMTVHSESDRIISELSGGLERIHDPQLREIWKEMGWKGSAKARNFVFALRDYFVMGEYRNRAQNHTADTSHNVTVKIEDQEVELRNVDDWAKECISISHLQPILEAIDDDGSGFINIKELNAFTDARSRPEKWTRLSEDCRPDNRNLVNRYVQSWSIRRVERLLECTRSHTYTYIEPQLFKYFLLYSREEMDKLRKKLELIAYNIDSEATISLVCGEGRIEKYIYPLLTLLLERHMNIINLAGSYIINSRELDICQQSLIRIFSLFDRRYSHLEAVFKQMKIDSETYFRSFAFGMFQASFTDVSSPVSSTMEQVWAELPFEPSSDEQVGYEGEVPITEEMHQPDAHQAAGAKALPSTDILRYGILQPFNVEPQDVVNSQAVTWPNQKKGEHPMSGIWNGFLVKLQGQDDASRVDLVDGLFTLKLALSDENKSISGNGWSFASSECKIEGLFLKKSETSYAVDVVLSYTQSSKPVWMRCKGMFHAHMNQISGVWYSCRSDELPPTPAPESKIQETPAGKFLFTRTPADVHRFRPSDPKQKGSRKRKAKDMWKFALSAVQYRVRQKLFMVDFVVSTLREGRRFKELQMKHLIKIGYIGYNVTLNGSSMTEEEDTERVNLIATLGLPTHRFYNKIASFLLERITQYSTTLLCKECKGHTTDWHDESHVLMESEHGIPGFALARVVGRARQVSESVKKVFKEIEARPLRLVGGMEYDEEENQPSGDELDEGPDMYQRYQGDGGYGNQDQYSRNDDEEENQSGDESDGGRGMYQNQPRGDWEGNQTGYDEEARNRVKKPPEVMACTRITKAISSNGQEIRMRMMTTKRMKVLQEFVACTKPTKQAIGNHRQEIKLGTPGDSMNQEDITRTLMGITGKVTVVARTGARMRTSFKAMAEWGQHSEQAGAGDDDEGSDHSEDVNAVGGGGTYHANQTSRQQPQPRQSYAPQWSQHNAQDGDDESTHGENEPVMESRGMYQNNQTSRQQPQMRQAGGTSSTEVRGNVGQGRGVPQNVGIRGQRDGGIQSQSNIRQTVQERGQIGGGSNVHPIEPNVIGNQQSVQGTVGGIAEGVDEEYDSEGYPDEEDLKEEYEEYDYSDIASEAESDWDDASYAFNMNDPVYRAQRICSECKKDIVLPCWVDFIGLEISYLCNDCGHNKLPPPPHKVTPFTNRYKPALIWVRDSKEVKESSTDPIKRVEQGIMQVRGDIGGQLDELKEKIADHSELAARLDTDGWAPWRIHWMVDENEVPMRDDERTLEGNVGTSWVSELPANPVSKPRTSLKVRTVDVTGREDKCHDYAKAT